jgi:dihydrolipoamide dehydrogenase
LKDKDGKTIEEKVDRVLIAAGRSPVSGKLGLENTGVQVDDRGFIIVSEEQRTADPNIFAIGDVVKGPMLAHKAMRQGKIAAEVIAGKPSAFDVRAIPAVVYTDPQIAWCGLTENQARQQEIAVKVVRFPWSASGRAMTMGLEEGMTKLLLDPDTGRVLGAGIVGRGAEALIAENVLAIEMGALAEDLAFSIHPHPSLTETEAEAAEIFTGSSTHFIVR